MLETNLISESKENSRFKFRVFFLDNWPYEQKMWYPHIKNSLFDLKTRDPIGTIEASIYDGCLNFILCHFPNRAREVFPNIIQQCTGKVDCQNKEIYDGDILRVKHGSEFKIQVSWNDEENAWSGNIIGPENYPSYLGDFQSKNLEILGNILENPELLP